ncbi:MAG TPA: alpha-rhamnosidase [Bacteroidales bacterium]|nr:alpha-rhamnosidase [Bacteroidales bacterium]
MKTLLILLLVIGLLPTGLQAKRSQPVQLTCEYLTHPMGIDVPAPRFRWQIVDTRPGAAQTAYRIRIGTDSALVARGKGGFWDTGIVKSDCNLVTCSGKTGLIPFTRYFWTIQAWDHRGKKSRISPVASFETGMVKQDNWKGSWITDSYDQNFKPAPYFRKEFTPSGPIRSARAYITAAGLFELSINGQPVGDHRLDPLYTRFDKRNLYITHDVTPLLQNGVNAIGVILGNGWYNHQSTAVWDFHKAHWRNRPRFLMNLRITYEDGRIETIATGADWKTSTGALVFNSIYTAEHYDARLEQKGWNLPGFNSPGWSPAAPVSAPSENIVSQAVQPIRNVETIPAFSVTKLDELTWMFNLGRNIAGVSSIRVSGPAGTEIRLKHSEQILPDGRADLSNIDVHYRPTDQTDPFQTDIFILSGRGEETFMPRFNYKGFQYVEVTTSIPLALTRESLTGYFMHSDVPPVGTISSSNPLTDKIWAATNASYLSNLFGYPTDCPQREKNGWTGDAQIAIETGLFNYDAITVYEKWLADHQDEQQPNGVLPSIIPTAGWGYSWGNGPDWTSTIAIIPWNVYLFYGDIRLLKRCYDNIKLYVDHITEISPTGITDWGLGDWIPVKSVTPKEFTSSLYYYTDALILAKAARLLGKNHDYEKYLAISEKIADAINAKYLNRNTGIYGSGFQTELSAALFWGIVPDELKTKVAKNLYDRVIADTSHLDVGLLGTKTILNALSDNGYADLAWTLASNDTYPSWGFWIRNGATTLQENWPMKTSYDISRNHIMFGEIGAWFFKAPGGIKPDPEQPGFKNVILEPHFVKGLNHFEARHTGPFGEIVSAWKREGDQVVYNAVIPPNSTATLRLEDGRIMKLKAGKVEIRALSVEF